MQDEVKVVELQVPRAMKLPGVLKAALFAGMVVGAWYCESWAGWVGYVLASLILWGYIIIEGAAVEYFNKYTILKTLIEIKVLELDGTLDVESSLTKYETEKDNDTKTSTD